MVFHKRYVQNFFFFLGLVLVFEASAQFNLETEKPLRYAREAAISPVLRNNGNLVISASDNTLNILTSAGFSLSTKPRYIRFDFENAVFAEPLESTGVATSTAFSSIIARGGATGDEGVIIEVSATEPLSNTTEFILPLDKLRMLSIHKPVYVSYQLYATASDAIQKSNVLVGRRVKFLEVITGLKNTQGLGFSQTLTFGSDFSFFRPSVENNGLPLLGDATTSRASLAKFSPELMIQKGILDPSDSREIIDVALLLNRFDLERQQISISGNFVDDIFFLAENDDCSGQTTPLEKSANDDRVNLQFSTLLAKPVFCVDVAEYKEPLAESEYYLDLNTGLPAVFFGRLTYEGSFVNLPYLTIFSGYRQRILITNHSDAHINYRIDLLSDENITSEFSKESSFAGVLKPGVVKTLIVSDIVSIHSETLTRVAGRMHFDALPSQVSAAIQTLSLNSNAPPVTNVLNLEGH